MAIEELNAWADRFRAIEGQLTACQAENTKLRKIIELIGDNKLCVTWGLQGYSSRSIKGRDQSWSNYYPTAAEAALALLERTEKQ